MSNQDRFVSDSLGALLVSIADGVREAQDSLNSAPPTDAFGRPMTTYHLPYLDFEIKVDMETVSTTGGPWFLKINQLGGGQNNNASTRDVSSTISGRLVAIPPGDGLPTNILTLSSEKLTARRHKIKLSATNSAGEILAGHSIELNINLEASKQLSELEGVNLTSTRVGTTLQEVILETDQTGSAETIFNIDPSLSAKTILVLTAELGTAFVNLSVTMEGNS